MTIRLLLWNLVTSGRYQEALAVYRWYTPLLHLDTHVKLVQYIKLAMAERGLGSERVRAPDSSVRQTYMAMCYSFW